MCKIIKLLMSIMLTCVVIVMCSPAKGSDYGDLMCFLCVKPLAPKVASLSVQTPKIRDPKLEPYKGNAIVFSSFTKYILPGAKVELAVCSLNKTKYSTLVLASPKRGWITATIKNNKIGGASLSGELYYNNECTSIGEGISEIPSIWKPGSNLLLTLSKKVSGRV